MTRPQASSHSLQPQPPIYLHFLPGRHIRGLLTSHFSNSLSSIRPSRPRADGQATARLDAKIPSTPASATKKQIPRERHLSKETLPAGTALPYFLHVILRRNRDLSCCGFHFSTWVPAPSTTTFPALRAHTASTLSTSSSSPELSECQASSLIMLPCTTRLAYESSLSSCPLLSLRGKDCSTTRPLR